MYLEFTSFSYGGAQVDCTVVRHNDAAYNCESQACPIFLIGYKWPENGLSVVPEESHIRCLSRQSTGAYHG